LLDIGMVAGAVSTTITAGTAIAGTAIGATTATIVGIVTGTK